MMGVKLQTELESAFLCWVAYCFSKNNAMKAPTASSVLRRAIVLLSDQIANRALLIKTIKALMMKKERFEPMGFI
jgi:hypothetical protein